MIGLNCTNCCIGDFKHGLCHCDEGLCKEFKSIGTSEDFENSIMKRIDSRPKGEWIDDTGIYATCSVCKEQLYQAIPYHYCPNCGADMKGADNE